jgi:hypothetical protein
MLLNNINRLCSAYAAELGVKPEQLELEIGPQHYRYVKSFNIAPEKPLPALALDFDGEIIGPVIVQGYKDAMPVIRQFLEYEAARSSRCVCRECMKNDVAYRIRLIAPQGMRLTPAIASRRRNCGAKYGNEFRITRPDTCFGYRSAVVSASVPPNDSPITIARFSAGAASSITRLRSSASTSMLVASSRSACM